MHLKVTKSLDSCNDYNKKTEMSAKNPVQGETDKAWPPEKDTIKNKTKFQR